MHASTSASHVLSRERSKGGAEVGHGGFVKSDKSHSSWQISPFCVPHHHSGMEEISTSSCSQVAFGSFSWGLLSVMGVQEAYYVLHLQMQTK